METRTSNEREHDFTLVLSVTGKLSQGAEDALFEAGCDDATICVRSGRVYLSFSRRAPTLKDAILSAIGDVRKANIGADVLRVDISDLVTQADIGRRIERSRLLVHQYITGVRGPGGFPPPVGYVSDDQGSLWSWGEVANWLRQNDMITEEARLEAQQLALINDVLSLRHKREMEPQLAKEILQSLDPAREEPPAGEGETRRARRRPPKPS
jgi:hypothetical protein